MRRPALAICPCLILLLAPGCAASSLVRVVTVPVRVASKAVDLATTSQSEADEKRGREMRRQEENLGRLERSYQKHSRQCADGNESACARAEDELAELDEIRPPRGAIDR
jgi:hypothetical protein